MKLSICLGLFSLAAQPAMLSPAFAADQQAAEPVTWGMLNANTGCVIFQEGRKTNGHFYGVVVTTKSVGKLTVIETLHSTFDQNQVLETPENMDSLMQRAQKDHLKYVKIPEKYSPELLDKARAACKQGQAE